MFGPVPMMQNVAGQSSRHYFFERNDFMAEYKRQYRKRGSRPERATDGNGSSG